MSRHSLRYPHVRPCPVGTLLLFIALSQRGATRIRLITPPQLPPTHSPNDTGCHPAGLPQGRQVLEPQARLFGGIIPKLVGLDNLCWFADSGVANPYRVLNTDTRQAFQFLPRFLAPWCRFAGRFGLGGRSGRVWVLQGGNWRFQGRCQDQSILPFWQGEPSITVGSNDMRHNRVEPRLVVILLDQVFMPIMPKLGWCLFHVIQNMVEAGVV